MNDIYNKGRLCFIQHSGDGIKEYYTTDCTGRMLEVSTSVSNNITERLLKFKELPKEVFCKIFRTRECNDYRRGS